MMNWSIDVAAIVLPTAKLLNLICEVHVILVSHTTIKFLEQYSVVEQTFR